MCTYNRPSLNILRLFECYSGSNSEEIVIAIKV